MSNLGGIHVGLPVQDVSSLTEPGCMFHEARSTAARFDAKLDPMTELLNWGPWTAGPVLQHSGCGLLLPCLGQRLQARRNPKLNWQLARGSHVYCSRFQDSCLRKPRAPVSFRPPSEMAIGQIPVLPVNIRFNPTTKVGSRF